MKANPKKQACQTDRCQAADLLHRSSAQVSSTTAAIPNAISRHNGQSISVVMIASFVPPAIFPTG